MRVILAAAGTALLICLRLLFPGGAEPSAAGTDARPAEKDVTALTCRDLDAEGRPPLPPLWLDGYVSAQTGVDDVYLTWDAGRPRMEAPPELSAQCRRTPDMALTEAWKTAMLRFRSPDEPGKIRDALNLGYAVWKDARSLIRKNAARPENVAAVQENLFASLILWEDGRRAFEHGGSGPAEINDPRAAARQLARLSARLPGLSLGDALYLMREWPMDLAALTCRDSGGATGRGRFFFTTGIWLSGWAAEQREHEPGPGMENKDAVMPEAGSAFIHAYCARHPDIPVTDAWRNADDEFWRAEQLRKSDCADIFRHAHDAVGWLLWWDGYQSHPSTRLPAPETFAARSAAIRAFCATHPRMPFPDAARKALAALPPSITPPDAFPASRTAARSDIPENATSHTDAPRRHTGMAALTCREWTGAETSAKSGLPSKIWLDGYVSAQMNITRVPVGFWTTKYWVGELPFLLLSQCRRTPDMALTEAWKTVKMHEDYRRPYVFLDAPCEDLLKRRDKRFAPWPFEPLAVWLDGWQSWQERKPYLVREEETAAKGRALEAACKANPKTPLREIPAMLRSGPTPAGF